LSSSLLQHIQDVARGKIPLEMRRSGAWPRVRAEHLKAFPACAVCDRAHKVEVHHVLPFHLHPDLELDPANFITLCEDDYDGVNCHLFFGHLGNFKSFNENVLSDAAIWRQRIANRPQGETPAGPNNLQEVPA
jgi:5-methylcytosine-specific restriction enzyme A